MQTFNEDTGQWEEEESSDAGTGDTLIGDAGTGGFDWATWTAANPDSGIDAANAPTEAEFKAAIESGKSNNPMLKGFFETMGDKAVDFLLRLLLRQQIILELIWGFLEMRRLV